MFYKFPGLYSLSLMERVMDLEYLNVANFSYTGLSEYPRINSVDCEEYENLDKYIQVYDTYKISIVV